MARGTAWSVLERGCKTTAGAAACRLLREQGHDPVARQVTLDELRRLVGANVDGLGDVQAITELLEREGA